MNLSRRHFRSLGPARIAVWLLVLAILTTLAPDASSREKKRKKKKPRTAVTDQRPSGLNFDLRDWFHDARLSSRSTSIGQANRGQLRRSEKMDLKGRSWRFLPATAQRNTQYGTLGLVRLLQNVSDAVATDFPGSVVEIGNIGKIDGGPIVQSKSHQAGRDVDVAFFALDSKGRSRPVGRMLKFGTNLTAGGYTFDLSRNWALVKALVQSEEPVVQWAFVAGHLRTALLEYARQQKEPNKLIRLAGAVMHQPGDSSAHADHMHIRIFCNDWDRASGCRDYGPDRSTLVRDESFLDERLTRLNRLARKGLTEERISAIEALIELPGMDLTPLVDDLLCNSDPLVVTRAIQLLPRVHGEMADEMLARKLVCAPNPDTLYVLFKPVATYQHKLIWKAARQVLKKETCLDPSTSAVLASTHLAELCGLAAQTLGYSRSLEDGLLLTPLLESKSRTVRKSSLRGLQNLYVTSDPISPSAAQVSEDGPLEVRWSQFVAHHYKDKWASQAAAQLRRQGFTVDLRLTHKGNAAELLRAVGAGHPLSFTAQIALGRIRNVPWPRPLKARAAHARFLAISPTAPEAPEAPDADQADEPKPVPTQAAETAKTRKLPDLPVLD